MAVSPIRRDYPRVTPSLAVDGAAAAIDFYRRILGATERMRIAEPSGKVGHAELTIGESLVMVNDEYPEIGAVGPKTVGGTPVSLLVYVEDVDATFAAALDAGAASLQDVADRFYGDRSGQFEDPWGHRWTVATHIEDVPPEEMGARAAAAMGGHG